MIAERVSVKPNRLRANLIRAGLAGVTVLLGLVLGFGLTSGFSEMVVLGVAWAAQIGTTLLDPVLGLLLWVVVSPYAPFAGLNLSMGSGIPDLGLDRLAAGFLCVVVLAQAARRRRTLAPFSWLDGAILCHVALLTISARAALDGTLSALQQILDVHIVPLLIYFLAKNLVRDRQSMRWLTGALFVIAGYLVLLTFHEHLTGRELFVIYGRVSRYGENLTRVNSLLQNPAYIALALNLVLPFLLRAGLRTEHARQRWGYGLAIVAVLLAVFSLYNRAGWAGAFLVILVSALHYPRLRRWSLVTLAIAVPILAGFWTVLSTNAVIAERLMYGLSVDYRVRASNAVWELVGRQPIFGVGFGNFSSLSLSEGLITSFTSNYWVPTTHNSYLDVLVSAGVAALLPYLAVIALLGREIWRLYRRSKTEGAIDRSLVVALGAAFVAFVFCIATFDIAAAPFCAMVFWLIAGGVLGSQNWPTIWAGQAAVREAEA